MKVIDRFVEYFTGIPDVSKIGESEYKEAMEFQKIKIKFSRQMLKWALIRAVAMIIVLIILRLILNKVTK